MIEAFSAMRSTSPKTVPEEVIDEFNKSGSGVEHIRVEYEERQAADEAIKARIDELIELLEICTKQGKQLLTVSISLCLELFPYSFA